jgi:tetratricopeptide (TPR) repeat protein
VPLCISRWSGLLLLIVTVVSYLPSLSGEFVWDDQSTFTEVLPAFPSLAAAFDPPAGIPHWSYPYYRPVLVLSLLADLRLFAPEHLEAGTHVVNLLYHLLATFAVWLLARRLLAGRPQGEGGALLAALLFAVHPIHTETVSWVSGRSDLLATMFLLFAVLAGLRFVDRRRWWALPLVSVFGLAAVLSKETGVTFVLLVPLVLLLAAPLPGAAQPRRLRVYLALGGSLAAAVLAWLGLRALVDVPAGELQALSGAELASRLPRAAAYYLAGLLWPWPQSSIVAWEMTPSLPAALVIVAAALALTGVELWRVLGPKRRRTDVGGPGPTSHGHDSAWRGLVSSWHGLVSSWHGLVSSRRELAATRLGLLATGWIWIALLVPLFSAVIAVSRTPLAERHLYLASVGLCLGIGALGATALAGRWRRTAVAMAGAVIVVLAAATYARALVWVDDTRLWVDAVCKAPSAFLPRINLARAYYRAGDDAAALAAYREVLELPLSPSVYGEARTAIGLIYLRRGEIDDAAREFRIAMVLRPAAASAWYGLGMTHLARSRSTAADVNAELALANRYFGEALARNPGFVPVRMQLLALQLDKATAQRSAGNVAGTRATLDDAARELVQIEALLPAGDRATMVTKLRQESGLDLDALRAQVQSLQAGSLP